MSLLEQRLSTIYAETALYNVPPNISTKKGIPLYLQVCPLASV